MPSRPPGLHASPLATAGRQLTAELSRLARGMVALLAASLVLVVGSTWRVSFPCRTDPVRRSLGPVLYAIYHGRMLLPLFTHRSRGIAVLISHHGDGEWITAVARWLGFHAIRGSTSRGAAPALMELLRTAQQGRRLAITVDGPRGPRYRIAPGAVYVASRTGYPLLLSGLAASGYWQLPSWDEFRIPRPFARLVLRFETLHHLSPDLTPDQLEAHRVRLEEELLQVVRRAEREACGHPTTRFLRPGEPPRPARRRRRP